MSKIRSAQGILDEALRLASKALDFRKKYLHEHLKTCGSLYQVAFLYHKRGDIKLSR